MDELP